MGRDQDRLRCEARFKCACDAQSYPPLAHLFIHPTISAYTLPDVYAYDTNCGFVVRLFTYYIYVYVYVCACVYKYIQTYILLQ